MLFELERAEDKLPHVKGIGVSANHADERVKKLEENVSMMANNFNKLVQRFDKGMSINLGRFNKKRQYRNSRTNDDRQDWKKDQ